MSHLINLLLELFYCMYVYNIYFYYSIKALYLHLMNPYILIPILQLYDRTRNHLCKNHVYFQYVKYFQLDRSYY